MSATHSMNFDYSETQGEIREAVKKLCAEYGPAYCRGCDERGEYPEAFVQAMTDAGCLAALTPEEYGDSGLGIMEACLILEEVIRSGGNGATCRAQMYTMASLLNHGSAEQKQKYLPRIADGSLRVQAFGITEPDAGFNTLKLKTFAKRTNDGYVINGQKIWTSRYFQSRMYLFIARTTPIEEVKRKTDGLTLFLVDIAKAGKVLRNQPIRTMLNHHTNEVFIEDLHVTDESRIGEEGRGVPLPVGFPELREAAGGQRGNRRRPLVHRTIVSLRDRAGGVRQADRRQPGRAVSHRPRAHQHRGGDIVAQTCRHDVRPRLALRAGSEHDQVSGNQIVLGGGGGLYDGVRRLRRSVGIRYRARVERGSSVPPRADQQ